MRSPLPIAHDIEHKSEDERKNEPLMTFENEKKLFREKKKQERKKNKQDLVQHLHNRKALLENQRQNFIKRGKNRGVNEGVILNH